MLRTFEDICQGSYLYRDLMEHRMHAVPEPTPETIVRPTPGNVVQYDTENQRASRTLSGKISTKKSHVSSGSE